MMSIFPVVKSGLCVGCGTCAGVCPYNAISMSKYNSESRYLPEIDTEKCVKCKLCVSTCPGHSLDMNQLNIEIFGKKPEDHYLGNIIGCYVGYSNDNELRFNSSSGGIATSILLHLLSNNIVDGALVVKIKEDDPLETVSYIARNREDVLRSSGSKYCPVTLSEGIKEILEKDGKYVVVGLPCHIHGIRKAEQVIPELRKKIILHIGLFCSHMVNFDGTNLLFEKIGIHKREIKELKYRGHGWPGSLSIVGQNGKKRLIPLVGSWKAYWPIFSSYFFTPVRCMMCPDEACELADISLGDAWLPELKEDRIGASIIVARSTHGEKVLSQMKESNRISLKKISPEKVKQSQVKNLIFKKDDYEPRLEMLYALGFNIPDVTINGNKSKSLLTVIRNLYYYMNVMLSKNVYTKKVLKSIPFPLYRLYFGIYKYFLFTFKL